MRAVFVSLLGSLVSVSALSAASEADLRKDIQDATKRLSEQRAAQAAEAPLLGNQVAKLERELLGLRRQATLARMGAEGRKELHTTLSADVLRFERDAHYLSGVYRDFSVQMAAHFQPGHGLLYGEVTDAARQQTDSLIAQSKVLDAAMDQLESVLGGEIIPAEVVDEQGLVLKGKVANLGPASWFISEKGDTAGAVIHEKGASHARLVEENREAVAALFSAANTELSVDLTGGKARAIAQVEQGSNDLLNKGGVWLIPILTIALVSAVCGVIKMLQLLKVKEPEAGWVAEILTAVRADQLDQAQTIAARAKHPAAELISKAITYTSAGADVVEEVIYEQLIGVQGQLQKWLPFIAVTAATAPLLGLLGTVSGMIRMFNVITVTGTGDVKPMAGGISEALVTTLFGLIVAIPALIIHTMLSRKSNGVVQTTEKLGLTFVNGLRKLK